MVQFLIMDCLQNVCGCDHFKATERSKRYFNWQKSGYFSFLSDYLVTYATYKHMLKHYTALPVTSADCWNHIVLLKY